MLCLTETNRAFLPFNYISDVSISVCNDTLAGEELDIDCYLVTQEPNIPPRCNQGLSMHRRPCGLWQPHTGKGGAKLLLLGQQAPLH